MVTTTLNPNPRIEPSVTQQIKIAIVEHKQNFQRLPLADNLGSDEDMRKAIQTLSDIIQTLSDRITVLEKKMV